MLKNYEKKDAEKNKIPKTATKSDTKKNKNRLIII
jgi:hypothetical protein